MTIDDDTCIACTRFYMCTLVGLRCTGGTEMNLPMQQHSTLSETNASDEVTGTLHRWREEHMTVYRTGLCVCLCTRVPYVYAQEPQSRNS